MKIDYKVDVMARLRHMKSAVLSFNILIRST